MVVKNTAIATDSIACITREQAAKYDLRIVPTIIFFEDKVYRDWVGLSPAQTYEFLNKAPESWKSSAASPQDYLDIYREVGKRVRNILVVTISSRVSMFYQSALNARELAREELPGCPSRSLTAKLWPQRKGL